MTDAAPPPASGRKLVRAPTLLIVAAAGFALGGILAVVFCRPLPPVGPGIAMLALGTISGALASAALFETRRDRILAALLAAAGVALCARPVAAWAFSSLMARQEQNREARVRGRRAPDFALRDLGGRTVRLSDFRGRVVVIDVWRTWCGPCRRALVDLAYAWRLLGPEGLVVLGLDAEPAPLQEKVRDDYGVQFPLLREDPSLPPLYSEVFAFPTTFLIGRDGRIVEMGSLQDEDGLRRIAREVRGLSADPPVEELIPAVYRPGSGP